MSGLMKGVISAMESSIVVVAIFNVASLIFKPEVEQMTNYLYIAYVLISIICVSVVGTYVFNLNSLKIEQTDAIKAMNQGLVKTNIGAFQSAFDKSFPLGVNFTLLGTALVSYNGWLLFVLVKKMLEISYAPFYIFGILLIASFVVVRIVVKKIDANKGYSKALEIEMGKHH